MSYAVLVAQPRPLKVVELDERPRFVPRPAEAHDVLHAAGDKARAGVRGAMATVLARSGSAPSTPGQKLYVARDGTCIGTVGGGAVEREVLDALARLLDDEAPKHAIRTFKLGAELGMCCGGAVEVLLEPLVALVPCLLVGGGHVATAVAPLRQSRSRSPRSPRLRPSRPSRPLRFAGSTRGSRWHSMQFSKFGMPSFTCSARIFACECSWQP